jgi:hypothetical protein
MGPGPSHVVTIPWVPSRDEKKTLLNHHWNIASMPMFIQLPIKICPGIYSASLYLVCLFRFLDRYKTEFKRTVPLISPFFGPQWMGTTVFHGSPEIGMEWSRGIAVASSCMILQAWHHPWNHGRHGQFLDAENAKFLVPNGGFPPCFFFLPRDRSSHFCGFIMFHPIHHGIWGMFKTRGKLFHYCWLLLVIVGYTMLYPSINHHWIS